MPRELDWTDTEEIGIQLQEMFPETDPYSVRFSCRGLWAIRRSRMRGFWRRSRRRGTRSMWTLRDR